MHRSHRLTVPALFYPDLAATAIAWALVLTCLPFLALMALELSLPHSAVRVLERCRAPPETLSVVAVVATKVEVEAEAEVEVVKANIEVELQLELEMKVGTAEDNAQRRDVAGGKAVWRAREVAARVDARVA